MLLSISNIAFAGDCDGEMFRFLENAGYSGIEIAPTRLNPDNPYNNIERARGFANHLRDTHNLHVSSMQSIWYGIEKTITGPNSDIDFLIDYTYKAQAFARALSCKNIVFGCPKNRVISTDANNADYNEMLRFFGIIGQKAAEYGQVIAIEPNPVIYGTNFLNTTQEAVDFIRAIDMPSIRLNLDLGTVIYNNEPLDIISQNLPLINHIHISQPRLAPIEQTQIHTELSSLLKKGGYNKYISIEMAPNNSIETIKDICLYVKGVFS